MKRAALAIAGTITTLVMLLSFKTHSQGVAAAPPSAVSTPSGSSSSSGTGTSSGGTSAGKATHASTTVTGAMVNTRYGPVQVQVTVSNGTLTGVRATTYPMSNPRDAQINSYAIPALNSEALSAKSAQIDMVSGATYTSQGYLSSLQSALSKAGL